MSEEEKLIRTQIVELERLYFEVKLAKENFYKFSGKIDQGGSDTRSRYTYCRRILEEKLYGCAAKP